MHGISGHQGHQGLVLQVGPLSSAPVAGRPLATFMGCLVEARTPGILLCPPQVPASPLSLLGTV